MLETAFSSQEVFLNSHEAYQDVEQIILVPAPGNAQTNIQSNSHEVKRFLEDFYLSVWNA